MRPKMGLHTEEEKSDALNLTTEALHRGFDAFHAGDPIGIAAEMGYIKGISDLAAKEGYAPLARTLLGQVEDLKEKLHEVMARTAPQLGAGNPNWFNRAYGPKPKHRFETLEQKEQREQLHKVSAQDVFREETAGEESEMPVLFYQHSPMDPEILSTYVHTPEAPEMTLSDIYDVIHCRGRWSRLNEEGYPCRPDIGPGSHPGSPQDIAKATQFLLSKGFKPLP